MHGRSSSTSDEAWIASTAQAAGMANVAVPPHKSAESRTSTARTRLAGASSVARIALTTGVPAPPSTGSGTKALSAAWIGR